MRVGDTQAAVRDLHMHLYRVGSLPLLPEDIESYDDGTAAAVVRFQQSRRLRADGICDRATWDALIESNYHLGDRLLYLQKPMVRGDDVEDLQRRLGMMGFNAGRVDGIFGPDTQRALSDFQRNAGLTVDGICGHQTLASMRRIDSHVGDHTVAEVREREHLRTRLVEVAAARLVVSDLGGQRALAELTARQLRQAGATVAFLEQPDESEQAHAANEFNADVFIGLALADEPRAALSYFAVPQFESEGGKLLARLMQQHVEQEFSDVAPTITGMRLPVLRETRMPAVTVDVGPSQRLTTERYRWATVMSRAVLAWLAAHDSNADDRPDSGSCL